MGLKFVQLSEKHFSLLLQWLEKPHIKAWWDSEIQWTTDRIVEKYGTYVKGYKIEHGSRIKISAYLIYDNDIPFGYVQAYNPVSVPKNPGFNLNDKVVGIDFYIGEEKYLGRGFGVMALNDFLNEVITGYDYVFVDPDEGNKTAINLFSKLGFQMAEKEPYTNKRWMLKRLSRVENGPNK